MHNYKLITTSKEEINLGENPDKNYEEILEILEKDKVRFWTKPFYKDREKIYN